MYRKILVPLDRSEEAEKVIPIVQRLIPPGGEVVLLHVMSPFPQLRREEPRDAKYVGGVFEQERVKVADYLDGIVKRMEGGPVRWRADIAVNASVAEGIADVAVRQEVDLVAMYTHDRKGLARLIRGSIADKVRRKAPAEVRVFRPPELETEAGPPEDEASLKRRVLKAVDVFKGLSDEQIDEVAAIAHRQDFAAGSALGKAGEQGDNLFIIVAGEAQLTAHSAVGEVAVRIAAPGDSWPLAVLVGAGALVTSGKALTDLGVLSIPRRRLVSLCSQDPDMGRRVYANVAEVFTNRYSRTLAQLTLSEEKVLQANIEGG